MYIKLLVVGKTERAYLKEGIDLYLDRLKHYISFKIEIIELKNAQNLKKEQLKEKEENLIIKKLSAADYVILLDEKGKQLGSVEFANTLENLINRGISKVVFIVGGAYGVSESLKKRANMILSLSKMTFSHQMVRLFFVEQLYRAMTILKGEDYHHG